MVVVKAIAGGSFSVQGLPAGTYGIFYTTSTQSDVGLADVTISHGETLTTGIPAGGAITVYAR